MITTTAAVLFRPEVPALRYLPEGPYPCGSGRISWVAIQHGSTSKVGSLNILDLARSINDTYLLPRRPGFAFATDRPDTFVIGLEHEIRLFDTKKGELSPPIAEPVERDVLGTIINDGILFDGGLIFGCKDLQFVEKKAGLYLWRRQDRRLIRLRSDQICSNGKAVVNLDGQLSLVDIDSPTKTVVAYPMNVDEATLGDPRILVDLRSGDSFPDGMIVTPDLKSVIVAFYNPNDVPHGEARQFSIATGEVEAVWTTPGSPRVTCPQLVLRDGAVSLVLTTAAENMSPDQLTRHPNAGCLFIADTSFTSLPAARVFAI